MPVFRIDRGLLRPARYTADGRARVDAYLTRSGVFEYRNPDGTTRREYRPESEVFDAASLDTLAQVPLTDDHPPESVNADNATRYTRGAIGDTVRRDGDKVAATAVVFDAALIAKMRTGKVETSCGYHCDVDDTPGVTPDGKPYDCVQRNIRYNHVAIVDVGRAGPDVRVRMDAATTALAIEDAPRVERIDHMALEDKLVEIAELKVKLAAALAESKAAAAERDAERVRADRAEGERDAERARADAAATALPAKVNARVALIAQASSFLAEGGKAPDLTGQTDRQIRCAVIKRIDSVDIADDKSDEYVAARYDRAIEVGAKQIFTAVPSDARSDGAAPAKTLNPEQAARQRMLDRNAGKAS